MRIANRCAPVLLIGLVGLGLWWSWQKWPDPLIDFGRELYVPWRLAMGDVLYRDIAYWSGPLSVYWHALLFRLFGVSLLTVVGSNACVLLLTVLLVFRCCRRVGNTLSAFTACAVILGTSAFAQIIEVGNYNFIAPYRHELTHGLLLGFVGIECAAGYLESGLKRWVWGAGLALGLCLLTKVEVVIATTCALPLGLGLALAARKSSRREVGRVSASFAAAALLPALLALTLLATQLSLSGALSALLGPYRAAASGGYTSSPFFRDGAGLNAPGRHLVDMVAASLLLAILAGIVVALARVCRTRLLTLASGALLLTLGALVPAMGFLYLARALPVLMLVGTWLASKSAADRLIQRAAMRGPLLVFSALFLIKLGLNARTFHYGFVLAVPALVVVSAVLVCWLPDLGDRSRPDNARLRVYAALLLLSFGFAHLRLTQGHFDQRVHGLGSGADRILGDSRAQQLELLRATVEAVTPPSSTLTVMPEGVILSYLTRRRSAIANLELIPTELAYFGEAQVLARLRASPPDYVAVVPRDTSEYGARSFGRDYALDIASFLTQYYAPRWDTDASSPVLLTRRAAPARETSQ